MGKTKLLNIIDSTDVVSLLSKIRNRTERTTSAEWPLGILFEINYLPDKPTAFVNAVGGSLSNLSAAYIKNWDTGKWLSEMNIYQANKDTWKEIDLPNCSFANVGFAGSYQYIERITLGVPDISAEQFLSCRNLRYVNFPNVIFVKDSGFRACSNLLEVHLPQCKQINSAAFQGCTYLQTLSLPKCNQIDGYGFAGCSYLTSFRTETSSLSLGEYAFADCWRLETVYLPQVENLRIGTSAFKQCFNLTAFMTDASNIQLDSYAFYHTGLSNIDHIINNLSLIPKAAFGFCSNLVTITATNITNIEAQAFASCSSLSIVNLPAVTEIGSSAFYNCTNLKSVYIGSALSFIASSAFYSANALELLDLRYISSVVSLAAKGMPNTYELIGNLKIYVPDDLVASYKKYSATNQWRYYADYIHGSSEYLP